MSLKLNIFFQSSYVDIWDLFSRYLKSDNLFWKNLIRLNLISGYFYNQLYSRFLILIDTKYMMFSKMQYLYFTKRFALDNFYLFLYENTPIKLKNRVKHLTGFKKKFIKPQKVWRFGLNYRNILCSWHGTALSSLTIRAINTGIFYSMSRFRKKVKLFRPLFIHLHNQKFIFKYFSLKYNLYSYHDFPYNIYYEHIHSISISDIYLFLNKFCGMLTFSGNRLYALNLIIRFKEYARNAKINFYDLLRHLIFHYIPFVYLKVLIIKRRRITRPTLLSKEKSFFFVIKWWKEAAKSRKGNSFAFNLFAELLDIYANKGIVVQKFKNSLLMAYNARSDLKRSKRRRHFMSWSKTFTWSMRFRRFLNAFLCNTRVQSKWTRKYLWRKGVISSIVVKKILLHSPSSKKSKQNNLENVQFKPKSQLKPIKKNHKMSYLRPFWGRSIL